MNTKTEQLKKEKTTKQDQSFTEIQKAQEILRVAYLQQEDTEFREAFLFMLKEIKKYKITSENSKEIQKSLNKNKEFVEALKIVREKLKEMKKEKAFFYLKKNNNNKATKKQFNNNSITIEKQPKYNYNTTIIQL